MTYNSKTYTSSYEAYSDLEEKYNTTFDYRSIDKNTDSTIEVVETPTSIVVGMLKHDDSPSEFFQDDENDGTFKQFRSAEQRDNFLATLKKSSLFYLVDKYDHGNVHYSVAGTKNYPDQQWDVSHGCAVFIPCNYIQDEYTKAKKQMTVAKAKEKFISDSNATLDSYSDYCNGNVYGYSIKSYDFQGKTINNDECWGFIGHETANEAKQEAMKTEILNCQVFELMKHVDIIKFTNENMALKSVLPIIQSMNKDLDIKDIESGQYTEVYGEKILTIINKQNDTSSCYLDNGKDPIVISRFEQWQKEHRVTAQQFSEARFMSDIQSVIRKNLKNEENNTKKISSKP